VKESVIANSIQILDWPARSPNLNLIENVEEILSDIVYAGRKFQNKQDLWKAIREAAEDIDEDRKV